MEGSQSGGGGGGGGGGSPAPFLVKTYEMVDDSSTDDIVSWSSTNASFVVWDPPDFAARLLPTYFKHNNFSSFIRQLNTYGFRKIDPERWEFANEEFLKGQKHLLKNIHRRKPIHSHSHPLGSIPDSERSAFEEEIERLAREKAALQAELWRFKQQQSGTKIQLEDLERRLLDMEQRQIKMITFLQRAVDNPKFVENLVRMAGSGSEDFVAIHKKRRLPGLNYCQEVSENSFYDNHSSSTSKPDSGQVFSRDFCDKLKLELCPAISGSNLVSPSTPSSNEDLGCQHRKQPDKLECLSFVPEQLELSDTGNSFCSRKNVLFPKAADEGDGLASFHLNLTLASSSMQVDRSQHSDRSPLDSGDQGVDDATELRVMNTGRKDELGRIVEKDQSIPADSVAVIVQSLQDATSTGNQVPAALTGRVNDVFWEQFLTERPGSSDTEEASSSLRAYPCEEQTEEKTLGNDSIWRNKKDMEQLTL